MEQTLRGFVESQLAKIQITDATKIQEAINNVLTNTGHTEADTAFDTAEVMTTLNILVNKP